MARTGSSWVSLLREYELFGREGGSRDGRWVSHREKAIDGVLE